MIRTIKGNNTLSSDLSGPSIVYQRISKMFNKYIPLIPSQNRYNLTLCKDKKFLWFRVAKVGTRTIFNIFENSNIKLDAEQPFGIHYPLKKYAKYFKFAFVRNPWDRLVSCWHNKVVENNYFNFTDYELAQMKNFSKFINFVENIDVENCDLHLRLQTKLIDLNNIDYIGRFEKFEIDLKNVLKIINLNDITINKRNVSRNRLNYREYYNSELKARVEKIYYKDVNILSYKF